MRSKRLHALLKRGLDIAVAGSVLSVVVPLVGVAGAAVKLDSPGPMFYRSRRVGQDGRPFDLLKLRTMSAAPAAQAGPQVTASTDARITRVGRWLRRTKLDELPQLWNVVIGDVSLVGPRPEAPRYVERYPAEYEEILRVRPGLTDRATLLYVDEESILGAAADPEAFYVAEVMPRKMALYRTYVQNPSLREDVSILTETGAKVLRRLFASISAPTTPPESAP